jgi:hypothetical protein
VKTKTAFGIDKNLLELIKEKAKSTNRSLNNYVEYVLYQDVGKVPNDKTRKAIEEVQSSAELTTIENLKKYKEFLLKLNQ